MAVATWRLYEKVSSLQQQVLLPSIGVFYTSTGYLPDTGKSGRFSWNKTCEFPDTEVVRWFPGFWLNWLFPGIITVV
jgi:hypothetical protein